MTTHRPSVFATWDNSKLLDVTHDLQQAERCGLLCLSSKALLNSLEDEIINRGLRAHWERQA